MLQALAANGGFLCDEDLEQRKGCKGRDLRDHYVWNVARELVRQHGDKYVFHGSVGPASKAYSFGRRLGEYLEGKYKGNKKPLSIEDITKFEQRVRECALSKWDPLDHGPPAESSATPPVAPVDAKYPMHTFNTGSSGASEICSLGTRNWPTDVPRTAWKLKIQRSDPVQLYPGLTGRHRFTSSTGSRNSALAGRVYEWKVVVDTRFGSRGGFRFRIQELAIDEATGFKKSTEVHFGDKPQAAWNAVYAADSRGAVCHCGVQLCGFKEPKFLDLLRTASSHSLSEFTHKKKITELGVRRLRALRAALGKAFVDSMVMISPSDPLGAFNELRKCKSWRDEWWAEMTAEEMMEQPYILGASASYCRPDVSKETKMVILSMVAPHFPVKAVMHLFKAGRHAVCKARLHAADIGSGLPPPVVLNSRMKVDPQRFAYIHQWTRSIFAVKNGDPSSTDLILTKIVDRLYPEYRRLARIEMPNKKPMSRSYFYEHVRDGFVNEKEETCCCGGCVDGWHTIVALQKFIRDPKVGLKKQKERCETLDGIRIFLNGPYRWDHLRTESTISTHCMHYALKTGHSCYNVECEHEHHNTCSECNQWPILVQEIRHELRGMMELKEGKHDALGSSQNEASVQEIQKSRALHECFSEQLDLWDAEYRRYVGHIVRKHDASRAKVDLLAQVTELICKITIDYKQKVLSREHSQPQQNNFGKRGKSLHGLTAECLIPASFTGELPKGFDREGDFAIFHVRVAADDSDQDFWHSSQVLYTSIKQLLQMVPWQLDGCYLSSDGAVNYKSLAFTIMLSQMCSALNFKIVDHIFPEAGDGKDWCDRDFAGINNVIDGFMKAPDSKMTNANEIVIVLDSPNEKDPNANAGVANCALKIERPAQAVSDKWRGSLDTKRFSELAGSKTVKMSKQNMYHFKFQYSSSGFVGLRCWAYYEPRAEGKFISKEELYSCWPCDFPKLSEFTPIITAGAQLTGPVEKKLKLYLGKGHQKEESAAKKEKEDAKVGAKRTATAAAEEIADSYRTSHRCFTCERGFTRESQRNRHAMTCELPLTAQQQQDKSVQDYKGKFDTLRGADLARSSTNEDLVPLGELAYKSPPKLIQAAIERRQMHEGSTSILGTAPSSIPVAPVGPGAIPVALAGSGAISIAPVGAGAIPVALAGPGAIPVALAGVGAIPVGSVVGECSLIEHCIGSLVCGMVDLIVFEAATDQPELAAGWATKESCARPNKNFTDELSAELRRCYDSKVTGERMNQFEISEHLIATFRYGEQCLRPSQVQSWVSSESLRRKKAVMLRLAEQQDPQKYADKAIRGLLNDLVKGLEKEQKEAKKEGRALRLKEKEAEKVRRATKRQAEGAQKATKKEAEKVRKTTEAAADGAGKAAESGSAQPALRKKSAEGGSAQPALRKKVVSKGSRKRGRDPEPQSAQRKPERSPPAKNNKRQREPLLPGNVWAHACCGVQVAAQSYHDTKGCQGEAAVACKERLDALTEAPRGRRKTQKTSGK